MPELPEVETIKRSLEKSLPGLVIEKADIFLPKIIKAPGPEEFCREVAGKTIRKVDRRGKYLLINLSDGLVLAVHLRMTGRLIYSGREAPVPRYTHLILHLDNGHRLYFADMRQFGRLWLVPESGLSAISGLAGLGVEPLSPAFTPDYLAEKLRGRHTRLKPLLLDQRFIAGLGNIYADEALHRAGLHPLREAGSLSAAEVETLYRVIREVLEEGIKCRGTTVRDYVDGTGRAGTFQNKLRVYGRSGLPCPRCGETITRIKTGGRSACFCPGCQK
ncbi:bifunctional DNA-formamidopyrimidine glycosylase/DNA-(apurinic or apyrimidinic site) lyase [Desulfofundulus thermobenzoicus]|uniref:Formamidopyrimidine-DNA glycosylase n=1 Tax=Desulfofundulus thermobenzoicus TaxID=29376 RepID=A0A6N7IRW7_9FIRM|nr:bifunctional DNA-formamidopyrimidine glycosylase/DNA-(apurinic or apyrimidinic site) lyase [Desulfofundulus thermobenzoicus]MQL52792.1 bifunctional DNA-formamidopyrimidine glycosylase/DNA-(apurinic or apyrimidinic site) lyase [Desulfofundulus thermobenzoicus]